MNKRQETRERRAALLSVSGFVVTCFPLRFKMDGGPRLSVIGRHPPTTRALRTGDPRADSNLLFLCPCGAGMFHHTTMMARSVGVAHKATGRHKYLHAMG